MRNHILTITADHVNNPRNIADGRTRHMVLQCMGLLLPRDIGKHCFEVSQGVVQCESDEQQDAREAGK